MDSARVRLADGCPGCGQLWRDPGAEGQCSRCRRCLSCCGKAAVLYSCDARHLAREAASPGYLARSAAAYERWANNPSVLGSNRRIT
jgi:hypothetical protein